MKKFWWLLLLVLLVLLLLFLHYCKPGKSHGNAELELGPVGYAAWPDGTLALAIPIINTGTGSAADVKVSSVTLGTGALLMPTALPVGEGEIVPGQRSVLQARFGGLSVPGTYLLGVGGGYTENGTTHAFTATVALNLAAAASGPIATATTTVPKQKTSGVPTAPSPIAREFEGNNELGAPVPIGPPLHPFTVAPTGTGPVQVPSGGSGGGMSITFIRNTGSTQPTGVPPDPSTAAASGAGVVLSPNNTYMLFSRPTASRLRRSIRRPSSRRVTADCAATRW